MYKSGINPLVSVITPTFNRAHVLPKAVESILQQTHSNLELIIIDDCSTDNTRDVVNGLMQKDGRVKFIPLKKNSGASTARNAGLDIAKGDYITFIDSDDQYDTKKIERQLTKFLASDDEMLGVLTCGRKDFRKGELYNEWVPNINKEVLSSLFKDKRVGAGTPFLMVSRKVIDAGVRFDTNINVVEDFDFVVQSLMKGFSFDIVPEPLVFVHHDEEERNFNYERGFNAREYLYKKYASYLKEHEEERTAFLWKTCFFYIEASGISGNSKMLQQVRSNRPIVWWYFSVLKKMPKGKLRNVAIKLLKANLR